MAGGEVTTLALRQFLYLVFVEVPLKVQDFFSAVFGYVFRAVWWVVKWSLIAGVCWFGFLLLADYFRELNGVFRSNPVLIFMIVMMVVAGSSGCRCERN